MSHKKICTIAFFWLFMLYAVSCNSGKETKLQTDTDAEPDGYHADFDIAMTLQSITDAIKVGEPLDSADYDFIGVLTDGQGHPLYTDIQGNPGEWQIDVINPTTAVIRNMYLGDLLPDDLTSYVTTTLSVDNSNLVEVENYDDSEETEIMVYNLNGAYLRIETRAAIATNGLEGPLMRIVATKDVPS